MAVNDLRLMNVRKDLDALHHGIMTVKAHVDNMNALSANWTHVPDAMLGQLEIAVRDASVLHQKARHTLNEAESLANAAPSRPPRSLGPGQPSAPPLGAELGGKMRRLLMDVQQLDGSLHRFGATVHEMLNDPLRHGGLASNPALPGVKTVADMIGVIGDVVTVFLDLRERLRRRRP
jgi:hypothetical protein